MAFLFQKFQEAVKVLAKSPTLARDGRHLQFEADMNRLFLYTRKCSRFRGFSRDGKALAERFYFCSYNRLGKNAEEADADEIIDLATKASLDEQQKQVQENIHAQINNFCTHMDDILLPDSNTADTLNPSSERNTAPRRSGLGLAVGSTAPLHDNHAVAKTKPLKRFELSQKLKDLTGYTLEIKPSQIQHEDAGQGLYLDGEADAGSVIAIYPGVTYSPAYYRYIPGYPRVDLKNPYLITRYDGTVINAQPWGTGGETREMWDGSSFPEPRLNAEGGENGSDRVWKLLSKPLDGSRVGGKGVILERRNPLAFAFCQPSGKGYGP
ncbi:hypothetical protein DH2020_032020 [Rehmannia glutinosa]|uniref:Uncharacterized protein n=1 Tax=Rehmannia glutinosa TaxID=99300 RepID=A0ABR0VKA3_REHGL